MYFIFFSFFSDGCARTGAFITIAYTLDRLNVEGTVDIFHAVKLSRIHRAGLVGNEVSHTHYTYII